MDTIGFICRPDDPVFWPVAERLSARGFEVQFFDPRDPIRRADIDALAAVVNRTVGPPAFAALRYADRTGVPTWNGFVPTTALSCHLVALHALETVGCTVPEIRFEKPDGEYVARTRYRWDATPAPGGEGDFYQHRPRADAADYRYYAVDDGINTHVRALRVRSALTGKERVLDQADVDVGLATRLRELLDRFEARALGVDFTEGDEDFYALDVTPVPTFTGTGMERRLADSVASLTTIGA